MSESSESIDILIGSYYTRELYAAKTQQEEANDPRINKDGDIEYTCQYYIIKRNDEYLVTND